ncbi:MAG: hypothetical protein HWQ38_24060 [Nostoc sp. NMS7]|uniref:hypothetical protein n=1 Tax=Nostoc sp. NMS7 TaxID=2815391 RepID=UPI0025CD340B|nr:hypothetical protein [Nostoc sp. NMS7]MBN3949368.1 hypothetical protein [Nostoc sp. NMS7]
MEITLRNKTYIAEHLTDTNYLALGDLFLGDHGQFYLDGVDDYESLSNAVKNKLTQPLRKKLSNPEEKAAIAHSLSAIFPSLPRELVRYNGINDFAMNLTLHELLSSAITIGNALNPQSQVPLVTKEKSEITPVQEAAIVRLWSNIEQIKDAVDSTSFEDSNTEDLDRYRSRIDSILGEAENYADEWGFKSIATGRLPSRKDVLFILNSIQGREDWKRLELLKTANIARLQEKLVQPSPEELARAANIARLEEELKFAKSGRGFGDANS